MRSYNDLQQQAEKLAKVINKKLESYLVVAFYEKKDVEERHQTTIDFYNPSSILEGPKISLIDREDGDIDRDPKIKCIML